MSVNYIALRLQLYLFEYNPAALLHIEINSARTRWRDQIDSKKDVIDNMR